MSVLLQNGDRNANVALWQKFLRSQGFVNVSSDGIFGPATESATRGFQNAYGLRGDGKVGEMTTEQAKLLGFNGFTDAPGGSTEQGSTPPASKLSGLHPQLVRKAALLLELAKRDGFELRVVQGLRTFAEQDKLFNQWRDGRDNDGDGRIDESDERVTRAAGGQSNHNYGLAVDLAFVVNGKISWDDRLYDRIGAWANACGLAWGGNWKFKDMPHVELPNCPNWRSLLATHKKGGLAAVWAMFAE